MKTPKQYTVTLKRTSEGLYIDGNLCTIKRGAVCCIENNSVGIGHTAYPNIDITGSVKGMKELGYWGKDDTVIKSRGYYYNTSHIVISDAIDALALHIEKGGNIPQMEVDQWKTVQYSFSV